MPKGQRLGELTGKKVGMLTLCNKVDTEQESDPNKPHWRCRCECGNYVTRGQDYLLSQRCVNARCGDCKKRLSHNYGCNSSRWAGFGEISGQYMSSMKASARTRHLIFDLTTEYLWELYIKQGGKCALSGLPLSFAKWVIRNGRSDQTASIDRINSAIGYVEGNVRWVHKVANMMRNHFDTNVFYMVCTAVAREHELEPNRELVDQAKGTRNASTGRDCN
jgi:hypothetical protein